MPYTKDAMNRPVLYADDIPPTPPLREWLQVIPETLKLRFEKRANGLYEEWPPIGSELWRSQTNPPIQVVLYYKPWKEPKRQWLIVILRSPFWKIIRGAQPDGYGSGATPEEAYAVAWLMAS